MCLNMFKSPFVTFVSVGIYLIVIVGNGFCDNSLTSNTNVNNESEPGSSPHDHNRKRWEDWLPPTKGRKHDHSSQHPIPLAPSEQAKFRNRKHISEQPHQSKRNTKDSSETPGSEMPTEGNNEDGNNDQSNKYKSEEPEPIYSSPPGDLRSIKETAMNFAKIAMNHLSQWQASPGLQKLNEFGLPAVGRSGRTVYLDNLGNRQDGPNEGRPEPDARRGVIDWLARLIGVQGKTLGEFLREYQVHVLYDLAFTFFKWIFFLYAGLLIP